MPVQPAIIPGLVYDNAMRGIEFLCDAFGFTRQLVVPGERDTEVAHAQLLRDGCMVMVSSPKSGETASSPGGRIKVWIYVVLDDPDAHHAHAAARGAAIIAAPHDNDYGGRGYEAMDCEGNYWSFGSYDPSASVRSASG